MLRFGIIAIFNYHADSRRVDTVYNLSRVERVRGFFDNVKGVLNVFKRKTEKEAGVLVS